MREPRIAYVVEFEGHSPIVKFSLQTAQQARKWSESLSDWIAPIRITKYIEVVSHDN